MSEAPPPEPPAVAHLELKASLLLLLLALLVGGSVLYLLYARGAFEATQRLVLVADDSEGVAVGMDLTFSGFPIGRVRRIELADDGRAHVIVDVASKDAKWLRSSSVFTLERSLVGSARLRAYSGVLSDPPLNDGAERSVLVGDAAAEIPRLMAAAKELVQNLSALSAPDGALASSLGNLQATTERLNGPQGALGLLAGKSIDGAKLAALLDRSNTLIARLDGLAGNADRQVFGPAGAMQDVRATLQQLQALLGDTRASLGKLDAVLAEAQAVGANARLATDNLGTLRAEVEANLRKIDRLVNEVNRKWPFARDTELKLP